MKKKKPTSYGEEIKKGLWQEEKKSRTWIIADIITAVIIVTAIYLWNVL